MPRSAEPPALRAILAYKSVKALLQLTAALLLAALWPLGLPEWLGHAALLLREHATHGWASALARLLVLGATPHALLWGMLALALDGCPRIWAIAADTDGIDGIEDNAGAIVRPDTLARAAAAGLNGVTMLGDNNAYAFFAGLGDLVVTGPTRTNVNDFRAVLISG